MNGYGEDGGPRLAVVCGSGLAVMPEGFRVVRRRAYQALGWPCTNVGGHANELLHGEAADGLAVLLAFGRPHLYEGWTLAEMERPLVQMASWGVRKVLFTYAVGGLQPDLGLGALVLLETVVDLQARAEGEPSRLRAASSPEVLAEAAVALRGAGPVRCGKYVAVVGPQYESPTEARWLRRFGDVVGMSGAFEARTADRLGMEYVALAAVVNRAAAADSHDAVLLAAGELRESLGRGVSRLVRMLAWRADHDGPDGSTVDGRR